MLLCLSIFYVLTLALCEPCDHLQFGSSKSYQEMEFSNILMTNLEHLEELTKIPLSSLCLSVTVDHIDVYHSITNFLDKIRIPQKYLRLYTTNISTNVLEKEFSFELQIVGTNVRKCAWETELSESCQVPFWKKRNLKVGYVVGRFSQTEAEKISNLLSKTWI